MIKEIVTDTEFLNVPCEPATAEDEPVAQDLLDTYESLGDDCACLAANQIGHRKCVILAEINEKPVIMYNPKLKQAMRPFKAVEGCLSLEGETTVTRYAVAKVAYEELVDGALVARTRRYEGWDAEVIQHAIDHTKGRLV